MPIQNVPVRIPYRRSSWTSDNPLLKNIIRGFSCLLAPEVHEHERGNLESPYEHLHTRAGISPSNPRMFLVGHPVQSPPMEDMNFSRSSRVCSFQ